MCDTSSLFLHGVSQYEGIPSKLIEGYVFDSVSETVATFGRLRLTFVSYHLVTQTEAD
jgi:hypothetical protein